MHISYNFIFVGGNLWYASYRTLKIILYVSIFKRTSVVQKLTVCTNQLLKITKL